MDPKTDNKPDQSTAVNHPGVKEIVPDKPYILVMSGVQIGAVMTALDATGRGAGADAGEFFWQVRGHVKQQVIDEQGTETHAAGLIAGRDAQRAEARAAVLKEDAAKATAEKTAAKRGKK